LLPN